MKYKLLITILALTGIANAQYTKLLDFAGTSNGSYPYGSLNSDGTFLYGMTANGGANNNGTIFKVKPDGTGYSKLLDFSGAANGNSPQGSLVSDGTFLYGMTNLGGTNDSGVIFKIKPDGTSYSKLFDFSLTNGYYPYGSLVYNGLYLYGMTSKGGVNNMGVIFKIKQDGTGYTKLLDFAGTNGAYPHGSLMFDGTFLYGMNGQGAANSYGSVFKIKPDGTGYVKLFDFPTGAFAQPRTYGSLVSDGTFLYGMTLKVGNSDGGTIFKIKPDGTGYAKLYDFAIGSQPNGDLIVSGNFLYGMTWAGGAGSGNIFKIKIDGTGYVNLFSLGGINGSNPYGSLISSGPYFYGMTFGGGTNSKGVLFKLCPVVTSTQSPAICSGNSIMVGSNTYTVSGTYKDTLTAVSTCDSIVTTNLTIFPAITNSFSITAPICGNNNGTIIATTSGSSPFSYSWSTGNTSSSVTGLNGSPTQTLVVTITDANSCILKDTAIVQCITGIQNYELQNQFSIFPNPLSTQTTLHTDGFLTNASLTVYNSFGQTVKQMENLAGQLIVFHRDNLPSGLYFVRLTQDGKTFSADKFVIVDE